MNAREMSDLLEHALPRIPAELFIPYVWRDPERISPECLAELEAEWAGR